MTEVFCHRGYSGLYPENTALAFRKALETGADGIELDVHLTRDGEVVIIHDELVDRTTDGTGFVKDMTLAELKRLNAAAGRCERMKPQRILTLTEYFDLVAASGIRTNIEFKTGTFDYDGIEEKVLRIVRDCGQEDRVIYSSFHAQTLLRLREIAPEVQLGLLNQDKFPNAARVLDENFRFQAYHPHFIRVTPAVVREMKERGLKINVYTPNASPLLALLIQLDVTSVITNYPERALKLRKRFQGI